MAIITLKRRKQFLRIRGGRRWSGPAFLMEAKPRTEPGLDKSQDIGSHSVSVAQFGFVVSRKLGNAVVRNRMRRRLKAAIQEVGGTADPNLDYVLVARRAALDYPFLELKRDVERAFAKIRSPQAQGVPQRSTAS